MMKWLIWILLPISFNTTAQYLKTGTWRGLIHYSDNQVPFRFEVSYPDGETPYITFINGKEKRVVNQVSRKGDSILILITPFDVEISASFTATSMSGSYTKHYRNVSYPFSASFGKPRMIRRSIKPSPKVEETWAMIFEEGTVNESKGVGLFKQIGEIMTGTVMTKVSDYRYFEGILDGDSIKLSCFDGAHAFLIKGKKSEGIWKGEMVFDDGYSEAWVGTPDANASIESPFEIVNLNKGEHKPYFDLLAAGSGKDIIDPSKYQNKVLVIQLFGTWCPNSHDQTKYLVDWYREHKDLGVEILASSYEANYSQEYGLRRINEYKVANDIPYEVVLGGGLSKSSAAMPFPFMDRIEAFPTLVIVDKEGYARYVHSYFNGPATGPYYDQFDQRFNEIIRKLVSE